MLCNILKNLYTLVFFVYFFGGLECVGHSFAYIAHFLFLGDIWIRTQRATIASRCATNLATHRHTNLASGHPSPSDGDTLLFVGRGFHYERDINSNSFVGFKPYYFCRIVHEKDSF
jgi:hypothetical protein